MLDIWNVLEERGRSQLMVGEGDFEYIISFPEAILLKALESKISQSPLKIIPLLKKQQNQKLIFLQVANAR